MLPIYNFYAASKDTDNDSKVSSVKKPKKKILYTNPEEIILSWIKFIFEKVSISCRREYCKSEQKSHFT